MYKPRPQETQQSNRVRLPALSDTPSLKELKAMFDEVRQKRGVTFEIPWTGKPGEQFLLMCIWDASMEFPVWTLYAEGGSKSEMMFSESFPPSDIELMYEVLVMSVSAVKGAPASKAAIPESLRPTAAPEESEKSSSTPSAPPAGPALHSAPAPATPPSPPPAPAPAPAPAYTPPMQAAMPPLPPSPYPGVQPMQPMPPYPPPGPYGQPMPPYPPPGAYGQPMAPYPPPAPMYPQQPPPQPNWQAQQFGGSPTPSAPAKAPSSDFGDLRPLDLDLDLVSKRANILLGNLLVEAGLITSPSLEAALKMQDLVRAEKVSATTAPDVLRKFHSLGASIDQYISEADLLSGGGTSGSGSSAGARPAQGKTQGAAAPSGSQQGSPMKDAEIKPAFDLLIKAGILTDNDIKTALGVRSKHGGVLREIVQAAGKVDPKTVDAALICVQLINKGDLKVEQCIIALNYCSRSRVGFDEALEELNWPNPRKR